jgi:hypothetical protein
MFDGQGGGRTAHARVGRLSPGLWSFPGTAGGPGSYSSTPVALPVRPYFLGSPFMTWRCSYEAALKPVETPVSSNGPYAIGKGALAAIATHEASHAVMMVCVGQRIVGVELAMNFERALGGGVRASVSGNARRAGGTINFEASPVGIPVPRSRDAPIYCCRAFLKSALVTCAGPAGEMKFRAQEGLPRGFIGDTDARPLEWHRRVLWTTAGRPGDAFIRLAWRATCRLMDVPLIWRAVQAVEAELFSGLLRLEPADPRPGDKIEFVMPGSRAEELIAGAGIAFPNILAPHQCGPECIRPSRKTSRRWERYLAEWAKEEPKDAA